jgi:hypothetical protein
LDWVTAPSVIETEIRMLWQEQELEDTLKDLPGYLPFHVSPDTQEWIDSMQEVRETDGRVVGLPKAKKVAERVIRPGRIERAREWRDTSPPALMVAHSAPSPEPGCHCEACERWWKEDARREEEEIIKKRKELFGTDMRPKETIVKPRKMPEIGE